MQQESLSDIMHLKNAVIGDKTKGNITVIKKPVLKIETLHSCFSHAVVDSTFPAFWVIEDLKREYSDDFVLLISKKLMLQHSHNLNFVDENTKEYKGVYNDLIKILTPEKILFEHLIESPILIENLFVYPDNDFWQRSPWNCSENYNPNRSVEKVRFSDDVIYSKLNSFRNKTLEKYFDNNDNNNKQKLIIIDRKHNRKFEKKALESLVNLSKLERSWTFNGIFYAEDLSFKDQVNLFASNNIFILRHGSCLVNLLWCPQESKVFEIEGGPDGVTSYKPVIERITKLTNSKRYCLNYNFDAEKDIFSYI